MKRRILIGLLIFMIAAIAAIGFVVWKLRTPPKVAEDFQSLPSDEQQRRREDLQVLENQLKDVARSARNKQGKSFTIEATEQQLNTLLQDKIRTDKFVLKDVRVGLEPGELTLQGNVPYNGMEAVATLTGDVKAEDGKIRFEADSLKIGGFSVNKYKDKVEKEVTKQLNKALAKAPGEINEVRLEKELMVVEVTTD